MSVIIRKGIPYGTGDTAMYSTAPVGSILAYGGEVIPDTYLRCDGASLSITQYPELYKAIGTTYGSVDDDHFNLPDLRGRFLEGTPSGTTLGTKVDAGLPNITGTVAPISTNRADPNYYTHTGAFSTSVHSDMAAASGDGEQRLTVNFDASKSNAIYGKSTTVQPPAICVNYIIKAKSVATSINPLDGSASDEKDYLITTRAEWEAMSASEKIKYDGWMVAFIEDVNSGLVMDSEVVQGSENPVSGDAVYNKISSTVTSVNTTTDTKISTLTSNIGAWSEWKNLTISQFADDIKINSYIVRYKENRILGMIYLETRINVTSQTKMYNNAIARVDMTNATWELHDGVDYIVLDAYARQNSGPVVTQIGRDTTIWIKATDQIGLTFEINGFSLIPVIWK